MYICSMFFFLSNMGNSMEFELSRNVLRAPVKLKPTIKRNQNHKNLQVNKTNLITV